MIEIRGHARGGQGMVTAFEILAKIFSYSGEYKVQAFPFFGVERTGAPIMAFFRISKEEIYNKSNIYHPNLVVVFDETIIDLVPVFDGLKDNGIILLNTEKDYSGKEDKNQKIYTVPATKIALEKGLGSKSLPIVNAAMIGALLKILGADIKMAEKMIKENVPAKPEANYEASVIAYKSVVGFGKQENNINNILDEKIDVAKNGNGVPKKVEKKPRPTETVPYWDKPMSLNKTGNWRVLAPEYVTKEAPCTSNCPAGTDVRLFVKQAGEGKHEEAFKTIYSHNPFPSTCGRVCPHFCQQNCNRETLDEKLNVGAIERYLGDLGVKLRVEPKQIIHKKKIAIIGAGPAGLTAALRLRNLGYSVTVYEALEKAGGMMRIGIPEFRLPQNVLDKEIELIVKQGVEIVLNKKVEIKELEDEFSAIIVATGAHISSNMNIANEELAIEGLDFLNEFKMNGKAFDINKGDKVAVIGGGNTAVDVARTTLRLGGEPTIYYRRTQQEMPAIPHEIEEALDEGVKIEFLTTPLGMENSSEDKLKLVVIKMELGEEDESGRRRPTPIKDSENELIVDKVITAIGQKNDSYAFGSDIQPKQGKLDNASPVFCAGDMAWGGTVTEAIGSGNEVAKEVAAFMEGVEYKKEKNRTDVVGSEDINFTYYLPTASHHNPIIKQETLFNNFDEVVKGLTTAQVVEESNRCLHCGDCYSCGNCFNYCPDSAIFLDENNRIRIDYDYCKGCGICANECPCSAIDFHMGKIETVPE
jgi:2-oxoacid:acceptor oxidoreductase gamma subunit (pyruvate/2-ketoisovalerate family)/2-oxoacid:acceptor oxidoreductase delta subunit (pyruvate/2-ketoisovalerate family)